MPDLPDLSVPLAWSLEDPASAPRGNAPAPSSSASAPAPRGGNDFQWPTPPYAPYPRPQAQTAPEPCEILGLNNSRSTGHVILIAPHERVAQINVPPARSAVPLKFGQFRALKLLRPIPAQPRGSTDAELDQRPRVAFTLHFIGGGEMKGSTIGHHEDELGLFLFPPISETDDAVLRVFVPREVLERHEIGERIGDVLVRDQAATAEEIEAAANEQSDLRHRRVGDILVARQVVSADQLMHAIAQQAKMPMVRIGEALLALDLISEQQLAQALEQQQQDRSVPLGELLVRKGIVTRQQLQSALARKMGYPLVDVETFPVEPDAIAKLPQAVARRLEILPLVVRDGRLVVAMEDPTRRIAIDEAEFISQLKVTPTLTKVGTLQFAIPRAYERFGSEKLAPESMLPDFTPDFSFDNADKLIESLERDSSERHQREDEQQIEQSDNSLVRLINSMIIEAHQQGVSDIHIETHPGREKLKIRFRRDGVLQPYLELPHTYRNAMIARIKIMCDLDISERRKPQDGKINFAKYSAQHKLELRIATIPTNNGLEDVVMRLLSSAKPIPLERLGLTESNLSQLRQAIERPYGMVLCVGPTGSGKTTTLHSALAEINKPERKIWTAEDPVEITQMGLRQVQVNARIDWTFAKALRAFLRADPDVIMVGEIRDKETAEIAVEASLTGHLVMSTLHTNSAAETVTRLLDMGMDPFNFADSLLAVLAQRLVRKLCGACKTAEPLPAPAQAEYLDDFIASFPDDERPDREELLAGWIQRHGKNGRLVHYHSRGCGECGGSGYKGRIGLHELLVVTRALRRQIQTGARAEELLHTGMAEGMRTLRQDGIVKVLQGHTSMAEVRATSNA